MVLGKLDSHMPALTCTKINSEWMNDLNVRTETLKLLLENIKKTLQDIDISNGFMIKTPILILILAQEIIARFDKWDCIKLKGFCPAKKE
jgi:hypothetical protein